MPNDEQKISLVEFSPEEAVIVNKEISEVLDRLGAKFIVSPFISPNGTIDARLNVLKVANGIVSPIQDVKGEPESPKAA